MVTFCHLKIIWNSFNFFELKMRLELFWTECTKLIKNFHFLLKLSKTWHEFLKTLNFFKTNQIFIKASKICFDLNFMFNVWKLQKILFDFKTCDILHKNFLEKLFFASKKINRKEFQKKNFHQLSKQKNNTRGRTQKGNETPWLVSTLSQFHVQIFSLLSVFVH